MLAFKAIVNDFKVLVNAHPIQIKNGFIHMFAVYRHNDEHAIFRILVDLCGDAVIVRHAYRHNFGSRIVLGKNSHKFVLGLESLPICMCPETSLARRNSVVKLRFIRKLCPVRLNQPFIVELIQISVTILDSRPHYIGQSSANFIRECAFVQEGHIDRRHRFGFCAVLRRLRHRIFADALFLPRLHDHFQIIIRDIAYAVHHLQLIANLVQPILTDK